MRIDSLDVFDDALLRAACQLEAAANAKARRGWQGIGTDARMLQWRAEDGWLKQLHGAWDGSVLLGFSASMTYQNEPDTSWIYVWVDPNHQTYSVGTALVAAAEGGSPATATRFVSSAYRRTSAALGAFEQRFAAPLGYAVASTETVLELDLGTWTPPSPRNIAGYEISTHINGLPEHLRKQVGQIKGLVDAQAPNGDLGWSETAISAQEYTQEIALWNAQGSTAIESVALDNTGGLAAWTCLVVAPAPDSPSNVEGTLVLRQHRGQGLGIAVKTASLHAAKRMGTVRRIRTSSDDQNAWMHSINDALGFVPVEHEALYQKSRSTLENRSLCDRRASTSGSPDSVLAEYSIDPRTLREIVTDVSAAEARILELEELGDSGDAERLGWLRMIGRLDEAEELAWIMLEQRGIARHEFSASITLPYPAVTAALRLAHVLQWQGRFSQAHALFESARKSIRNHESSTEAELLVADTLEAFALQHHGKLYFDQGLFSQALECFRSSLSIRQSLNLPEDQIASSRLAVAAAESRLLS